MAKPELGAKRQCQNCGTKFFDMSRDPIICPKCGTVFQALPAARTARPVPASREDAEVETPDAGAELVPLEEAEAGGKVEVAAEDEIEAEDDVPADDTFLEEEEEEDDDVADLIDGDIESDEEA